MVASSFAVPRRPPGKPRPSFDSNSARRRESTTIMGPRSVPRSCRCCRASRIIARASSVQSAASGSYICSRRDVDRSASSLASFCLSMHDVMSPAEAPSIRRRWQAGTSDHSGVLGMISVARIPVPSQVPTQPTPARPPLESLDTGGERNATMGCRGVEGARDGGGMTCPRCQHSSPPGARFCEEVATAPARTCSDCGAPLSATAKFCHACAHPVVTGISGQSRSPESYIPQHLAAKILISRSAIEGERKKVTVLFADLKGSMELIANRDPEEARKLLERVVERMIEAVHRYEGTVNNVMGDGIMALFGAALAHEDHATRACYAALQMQDSVNHYAEEVQRAEGVTVQIMVGLNSGEVVVGSISNTLHMDYTAVGQTTHLAARMEQTASPGSILITAHTLALVDGLIKTKSLGPRSIKGLEAPIEVYEVVGAGRVRSRPGAATAGGLSRFVGRQTELAHLARAFDRARAGHGQVVALVGDPGVGKSRLVRELIRSGQTHDGLVLECGAVSYGKATPYLPVIGLLRAYFQVESRDDGRTVREKG